MIQGIKRCSGKKISQEVRDGRYREGYDRFVGLGNFFVAGIDALILFEVLVLNTLHFGLLVFLVAVYLLAAVIGYFIYRDDYFD